jgi:hypothetical protein
MLVCVQYCTKNGTVENKSRPTFWWCSSLNLPIHWTAKASLTEIHEKVSIEVFESCKETFTEARRCHFPLEAHLQQPFSLRRITVLVYLRTYLDRLECKVLIVLLRMS